MNTTLLAVGMFVYRVAFDRWATYDAATNSYIGKWETLTTELHIVRAVMGQYVKVERVRTGYAPVTKWYNFKFFVPVPASELIDAWAKFEHAMTVRHEYAQRQLRDDMEYTQRATQREADKKAFDLSANTVTRAYVHASDNGYCIETVKALVSAGHKVPTVRLVVKATVLIPIELDGRDDYTAVRELMGRTRGNISSLVGENANDDSVINRIHSELEGTNASLQYSYYNQSDIPTVESADIEFGTPTIRPLEDVQSEAPAYSGDDDY